MSSKPSKGPSRAVTRSRSTASHESKPVKRTAEKAQKGRTDTNNLHPSSPVSSSNESPVSSPKKRKASEKTSSTSSPRKKTKSADSTSESSSSTSPSPQKKRSASVSPAPRKPRKTTSPPKTKTKTVAKRGRPARKSTSQLDSPIKKKRSTTSSLKYNRGDVVAIRGHDKKTWLGKVKSFSGDSADVQWFDELRSKAGTYALLKWHDSVPVNSFICPASVVEDKKKGVFSLKDSLPL